MITSSLVSVLVPAATYDLITLAVIKDDWGLDNTADAFLARTITRCSAAVAQFCNRVFPAEKVKDTFLFEAPYMWNTGLERIQLSRWPIVSVESVVQNGIPLVAGLDFITETDTGMLLRLSSSGNPTSWEWLPLVVTYTGGFTTIPPDVEEAVSSMVFTRYAQRMRDPLVKSSFIDGVERIEYVAAASGNMSDMEIDKLDNYRVPLTQ